MVRFEEFRHALGQIVGEQDLQTPQPVRILVFKNAKGWTSPAPAHRRPRPLRHRARGKSRRPAGRLQRLTRLLLNSNTSRMPRGFRARPDRVLLHLRGQGIHITVGAPPAPARSRLGAHPPAGRRPRILRQAPRAALQPAQGRRRGCRLTAMPSANRAAEVEAQAKQHLAAGNFQTTSLSSRPHGPNAISTRSPSPIPTSRLARADLLAGSQSAAEYEALLHDHAEGRRSRRRPRPAGPARPPQRRSPRATSPPPWRPAAPARAATSNTPAWSPTTKRPTQALLRAAGINPKLDEPFALMAAARHRSRQAPGALEGRRRAQSAQRRLLAGAGGMLPGRPQLRRGRQGLARRASRPPPIPPSASACARRAWPSSSSAWITKPPKSSARPTRKPARSSKLKAAGPRRTCTPLEAKYNGGAAKPDRQSRALVGRPQPSGKVSGTLKQVDCLGKQARLVVEGDDHKTVKLLVADPGKIAIAGGGEQTLGLRRAEAAPRLHRVLPQSQCPPGDRGRSGHHRVPVTRPADADALPLAGAGGLRALLRHQLSRPPDAGHAGARSCAPSSISRTRSTGWILRRFSITYAASAPFAGMLIDRIGLNRAISLAVGLWSCAGIATGFTRGLGGLVGCRAVLGVAEAGGIPAAGKAIHQYLRPAERALGNAVNQAGVSLGMILAPPLATWIAVRSGWRTAFVVTGVLGLLWIPVWNLGRAPRRTRAARPKSGSRRSAADMLRDRRLWAFVAANALSMVGYSLWTNWTTQYLVDVHHLTLAQAAWYAWIPPLFAMVGGFAGGWLSLRLMRPRRARLRPRGSACACWPRRSRWPRPPFPPRPRPPGPPPASRSASSPWRRSASTCTRCRSMPSAARARPSPSPFWWPPTARCRLVDLAALRQRSSISTATRRVTTIAALTPLAACAVSVGHEVGPSEAAAQALDLRPSGQRSRGRGGHLLHRRCRACAAAWRKKSARWCPTAAISWPRQRTGREMRRELKRLPHRPRAGDADARARAPCAAPPIRLAPRKILAYNSRLERHHLRLDLASFLFWRGVPLDRIYLRPWWWPWPKRERSVAPRGLSRARRPPLLARSGAAWPCSRPTSPTRSRTAARCASINLLREIAREFDVELFAFTDGDDRAGHCARAGILRARRAGEEAALPRAALVQPAAARSARVPLARHAPGHRRRARAPSASSGCKWNTRSSPNTAATSWWSTTSPSISSARSRAASAPSPPGGTASAGAASKPAPSAAIARVVVMSAKDAALLGPAVGQPWSSKTAWTWRASSPSPSRPASACCSSAPSATSPTSPPTASSPSGSGRCCATSSREMTLTVVCGPDPLTYWRAFADSPEPRPDPRIRMLGFVADVRPLYVEANLVHRAHHGLRRHQREGAGSHGHAARRGLHHLRLRRPGPAARPQRVGRAIRRKLSPPASPP